MTHALFPHHISRVVAVVLLCLAPAVAPYAQTAASADTMVLIRKFSGTRFAIAGTEAKVGSGLFGLSPEFEAVMGRHPEALRQARQVRPYSVAQLVGALGVAVAGGLALKESLDQAEDPLGAESSGTPLMLMVASGAVSVVGMIAG